MHVRSTHIYLTHTSKIESSSVHVYACTQDNLVVTFAYIVAKSRNLGVLYACTQYAGLFDSYFKN